MFRTTLRTPFAFLVSRHAALDASSRCARAMIFSPAFIAPLEDDDHYDGVRWSPARFRL